MAPPKTKVDTITLVHALADGKSLRQMAKELGVARKTLTPIIASLEIQGALTIEREKRAGAARAASDDHVAHITRRMADAASGDWSPDPTQLRIAGIMLGWWPSNGNESVAIGNDPAPVGSQPPGTLIPAGTPLHFHLTQTNQVRTETAPEEVETVDA